MTFRILAATAAVVLMTTAATAAPPRPDKTRVAARRYQFLLCRKGQNSFLGDWRWGHYGGRAIRELARTPHPDSLLVRRGQGLFVITDAVAVRAAFAALAPVEILGRRQEELGRQQGALGQRQGAFGTQQARASSPTQHITISRRQEELGHRQEELGLRQEALGRRQMAAMAKAAERLIPVFDAAFAQGKARPVAGGL